MSIPDRRAILWRRLDEPGHDCAQVTSTDDGWTISGSAVFADGGTPCRFDYSLDCDSDWRTRTGRVEGWHGNRRVVLNISIDASGIWRMNDTEYSELAGCVDLDLSFTPATNLLPIRRLAMGVGEESTVRSAWLMFPEFRLERLEQVYRRTAANLYHYHAPALDFEAELRVDEFGMILDYQHLWSMEVTL